jgi:hypothetical protein
MHTTEVADSGADRTVNTDELLAGPGMPHE